MVPYDPGILGMFDEFGLAMGATTVVTPPSESAPISYTSVWEEVADSIMRRRGAIYSSAAYIQQTKALAELYRVDGVAIFQHIGCRQYNAWVKKAKEVIEKELGIPALVWEGDYCDFRDYNAQQVRTRMETFAQLVKASKAGQKGNK